MKNFTKFAAISCLFLFIIAGTNAQTIPQYYNWDLDGPSTAFPFNITDGKLIQNLIPAGTIISPTPAPSGNITKYYIRISPLYPINATYTNFKILMGQTTINEFPAALYTGPMDTVFTRSSFLLNAAGGAWYEFVLDHPYTFDNTKHLVIQLEQCSASGSYTGYSVTHHNSNFYRRTSSFGGCPYVYQTRSFIEICTGLQIQPISGIQSVGEIPSEYTLSQNYPNPFNSVTKINFTISKNGFVTLKVFDALGREVKTLLNENKTSGAYNIDFDASEYASGIYFYKLEVNGFNAAKSMILLK